MRRLLVPALAAGAFLAAAPAEAKELKSLEACGASGCEAVTDRDARDGLAVSGEETMNPPNAGPYYRLRFTVDAEGREIRFNAYYVPSVHAFAGKDEHGNIRWMPLPAASRGAVGDALDGVEPYPAPKVSAATVGGRRVSGDPAAYLKLFALPADEHALPKKADWLPIDLRSMQPSPWTDGRQELMFSPSAALVERGIDFVPLEAGVAADISAARSLDLGGGSGFPWLTFALAAVAAAALAAATLFLLRRRPLAFPERRPTPA